MAIRTMRLEKDEILRKKSREVDIIDDKIQTLIDDMIETMYKYNGVGLSAVQVGVLKRVVVIDIEDGEGARVFINPKITIPSKWSISCATACANKSFAFNLNFFPSLSNASTVSSFGLTTFHIRLENLSNLLLLHVLLLYLLF